MGGIYQNGFIRKKETAPVGGIQRLQIPENCLVVINIPIGNMVSMEKWVKLFFSQGQTGLLRNRYLFQAIFWGKIFPQKCVRVKYVLNSMSEPLL